METFTIFIDNIAKQTHPSEIRTFFNEFGRVRDCFISKKERRYTTLYFGFVRFDRKEDAARAIRKTNGTLLKGIKLYVKWARFERKQWRRSDLDKGIQGRMRQLTRRIQDRSKFQWRDAWHDGRTYKEVAGGRRDERRRRTSEDDNKKLRTIQGKKSDTITEWLHRSIVIHSAKPREVEEVKTCLEMTWKEIEKVSDLGRFKFIVTFRSLEEKEVALSKSSSEIQGSFYGIRSWSIEDYCQSRRTWIEIIGLPPHAWLEENMGRIGDLWGDVVKIDKGCLDGGSFSKVLVQIDTLLSTTIDESIIMLIEDDGFKVHVKEIRYCLGDKDSCSSTMQGKVFFGGVQSLGGTKDDHCCSSSTVRCRQTMGGREVEKVPETPPTKDNNDINVSYPIIDRLEQGSGSVERVEDSRTVSAGVAYNYEEEFLRCQVD